MRPACVIVACVILRMVSFSCATNPCNSDPCLNGGYCANDVLTYICFCNYKFHGDNCEIYNNGCTAEVDICENGATCQLHDGNNHTCVCAAGYTGSRCESVITPCSSSPCVTGVCVDMNDSYACECNDPRYTGHNCEIQIIPCMSSPCVNGVCVEIGSSYVCVCHDPKYTGQRCEIQITPCFSNSCVTGLCLGSSDNYICLCTDLRYRGIRCEIQIDPCNPSPCNSHQICEVNGDVHTCLCRSEYTGANCSTRK